MRDIYAVFLTMLSMFLGMGLYTVVAIYVATTKRFMSWYMDRIQKAVTADDIVPKETK